MGLDEILAYMPSNTANIKIDDLMDTIYNFEFFNKAVKLEVTKIEDERVLCDAAFQKHLELRGRLVPYAPILLQRLFESKTLHLQEYSTTELSVMEKSAVSCLRNDLI